LQGGKIDHGYYEQYKVVKLEREKIGLNQSLVYIHRYPPILTLIFLYAPLQLSSQKNHS
jgi:hypothetical protein